MDIVVNVLDSLLVPEQENNHCATSPDYETQTYKVYCEEYGRIYKPYISVWIQCETVSIVYLYTKVFNVSWTSHMERNRDIY